MNQDIFMTAFFDEMDKTAALNIRARAQAAKQRIASGFKSRVQSAQKAGKRLLTPRLKQHAKGFSKEVGHGALEAGKKLQRGADVVQQTGTAVAREARDARKHWPDVKKDLKAGYRAAGQSKPAKAIKGARKSYVRTMTDFSGEGKERLERRWGEEKATQYPIHSKSFKVKRPGLPGLSTESHGGSTPFSSGRKVTTHFGERGKKTHVLQTRGHTEPKITYGDDKPAVGLVGMAVKALKRRKANLAPNARKPDPRMKHDYDHAGVGKG